MAHPTPWGRNADRVLDGSDHGWRMEDANCEAGGKEVDRWMLKEEGEGERGGWDGVVVS